MGAFRPAGGVTIRRLATGEHELLLTHLLRLDAEDRQLRFGGHVTDEGIRAYCAGLDWHRSIVLGGIIDGELRAVGELKRLDKAWPRAGELAVSVERPFRGRGIGSELCRHLIVRARNRFLTTLHMVCLLDNRAVQRIARELGGSVIFDHGDAEARLELPWPDPLSAFEEWRDETAALLGGGLPTRTDSQPWWGTPFPTCPYLCSGPSTSR
jgi:GNAT superfamily N-acetyltransferase